MGKGKQRTAKPPRAKGLTRGDASAGKISPKQMAIVALAPCYNAAALVETFTHGTFGEIDLMAAGEELSKRCGHVRDNQTGRMEDMLMAQAHSLDVMFASLARRAAMNITHGEGRFISAADTYMKLALRAQNQCRMTLETLATIKNPPVVFARQANIAHGHQQVNNGEATLVTHAPETSNQRTELLEAQHGKPEWMDPGAARTTARSDPAMATVEAIKRPKDA